MDAAGGRRGQQFLNFTNSIDEQINQIVCVRRAGLPVEHTGFDYTADLERSLGHCPGLTTARHAIDVQSQSSREVMGQAKRNDPHGYPLDRDFGL
jgi:hypothetical protein